MKRHTFTLPTFLTLALAAGTTSCLASSEEVDTLREVDDLVGRIELLHFEAELAKHRSEDALDALDGVTSNGFAGEPVEAFEQLVKTTELSEDQADVLRDSARPLQSAAEDVFTQWNADAEELRIGSLRKRSLQRLAETRGRYQRVLRTLEEAVKAYDKLNVGLRDAVTYLEHDFNASSIAAIEQELGTLSRWREEVELRLDRCMDAAERYVSASALPGTLEVAQAPQG